MKLLTLFIAASYTLACNGNTMEPDDLPLAIHGKIKDENGNSVVDVGVHLMFSYREIGASVALFQSRPNSRVIFASQGQYSLEPNYPNPFSTVTRIRYQLAKESQVNLSIHDMSGNLIKQLVYENQAAGVHVAVWNGINDAGDNVTNGLYTYRLQAVGVGLGFDAEKTMLFGESDPQYISLRNSIPLVSSDEDGEFRLSFSRIPFGETFTIRDETSPDPLATFTISNVFMVLLKEGYRFLIQSLDSDTTKTATLDFTLIEE